MPVNSAFERHAQTVLVMLLVALLVWVGNTTQNTSLTVARMSVELTYLKRYVESPKAEYVELSKRVDSQAARLAMFEKMIIETGAQAKP